jgi:hypothetical protein
MGKEDKADQYVVISLKELKKLTALAALASSGPNIAEASQPYSSPEGKMELWLEIDGKSRPLEFFVRFELDKYERSSVICRIPEIDQHEELRKLLFSKTEFVVNQIKEKLLRQYSRDFDVIDYATSGLLGQLDHTHVFSLYDSEPDHVMSFEEFVSGGDGLEPVNATVRNTLSRSKFALKSRKTGKVILSRSFFDPLYEAYQRNRSQFSAKTVEETLMGNYMGPKICQVICEIMLKHFDRITNFQA